MAVWVALARVRLLLPGNHSLKGKRHVLRRVIERVRARHPVSVGEVAEQDNWQVAVIGVAAVGNDAAFAKSVIDAAVGSIRGITDAPVADVGRALLGPESLSLESMGGSFDLAALEGRFDVGPGGDDDDDDGGRRRRDREREG